jgi:multidrug efflux pump subunit AcrB
MSRLFLQLPRVQRSNVVDLQNLKLIGGTGNLVPLSEITRPVATHQEPNIYRKNLQRVVYRHRRCGGTGREPGLCNSSDQ